MTKNDILEIKRRYNKESHNFTRIAGCYVDNEKNMKSISFARELLLPFTVNHINKIGSD